MQKPNNWMLELALKGAIAEREQLDGRIAVIRRELGQNKLPVVTVDAGQPARKKRRISPEGLERIRAAQKKRWAAHNKKKRVAK